MCVGYNGVIPLVHLAKLGSVAKTNGDNDIIINI